MSTIEERTSETGERRGLVSIIIPFLNAERFLEDAVAGIFAQTYQHWELLLVNDGSTDRSVAMAAGYVNERRSQVRCIQHADLGRHGISTSRNLGIANSAGEYIAFCDADDVWFPDKLERQVALLVAEQQAAIVFGSSLSWHSWTGRKEDLKKDQFAPVLEHEEQERYVDLPMLSVREVWHTAAPSGILVRRQAAAAGRARPDVVDAGARQRRQRRDLDQGKLQPRLRKGLRRRSRHVPPDAGAVGAGPPRIGAVPQGGQRRLGAVPT